MNAPIYEGYTLVHAERLTPGQGGSSEYRIRAGALMVRNGDMFHIYVPDAPKPPAVVPKGATHKWSCSGQYAKRCGGKTWAIWQDNEWLWIGDEFKGFMAALIDEREKAIRQMGLIVLGQEKFSVMDGVAALYDAGYRKFEIVEEDV